MSRMVSFLVLVAIIVGIGILFYRVMVGFLLPLFLAALLVVIFRPLHQWFLARFKGRPRIAAGLTTATVMLIVLAPASLVLTLAVIEASSVVTQFDDKEIRAKTSAMRESLGLHMPYADQLHYFDASFRTLRKDAAAGVGSEVDLESLSRLKTSLAQFRSTLAEGPQQEHADALSGVLSSVAKAEEVKPGSLSYQHYIQEAAQEFRRFKVALLGGEYATRLKEFANPSDEELGRLRERIFTGAPDWVRTIGSATGAFVLRIGFGVVIMVIALYFFLADGPTMISTVMRLSPLDDRHERELLEEFDLVSRAVVVATLLSAAVQGLLAGFGFWLAGVGAVFLLMLLTMVVALIPFVGAAAVWIPVSFYLFVIEGHTLPAVLLAVYGAAIVSTSDNVIKPLVLHGQSNLHPLLALLSVLGGVKALGPIGILVGPMVVVFLQTLLNILHRELTSLERSSSPAET